MIQLRDLFKNVTIILFAAFFLSGCDGSNITTDVLPDVDRTDHFVTQFGITWYFDQAYQTGQFANGDYWVVGPVTIVGIDPPSGVLNGRTLNGSMVNPDPLDGNTQGYDSATYGQYGPYFDATMNVARPGHQDLSTSNSLVLPVNSSLVSSVSVAAAGNRPQLQTVAILTVLNNAPPNDSFRPAYSSPDKSIRFNKSQIDYSLLSTLTPVANTLDPTTVDRFFERPWIDHVPNWTGRYIHPVDNMNDYGREIATTIGTGALMLNLDYTNAEKETLAIRFIQLGIDLYGIIEAGGTDNWVPNGGHASGRKLPILMAGHLLDDNAMKNIGQRADVIFGEDGQTFYVAQSDVANTDPDNELWNPDDRSPAESYIDPDDIEMPEWGIRHATNPFADNKAWTATYRLCCTANAWSGIVLTTHIMGLKTSWNHDALFDYQDRYMNIEAAGTWTRAWSDFQENMWDTYRSSYP